MFSISNFKSNVKVTRPNLFYAEIDLPSVLGAGNPASGSVTYDTTKFQFRCEATEIPGRTIATTDDQSYGPTTKFAYEVTYNDINLQIIASEDAAERKIFEKWMDYIVTPISDSNMYSGGFVKYYSNYAAGKVIMHQLKDDGTKIMTYTLYNAYPIQLSPMNLTWEESNTYQRFAVTMTYRYHTAKFY